MKKIKFIFAILITALLTSTSYSANIESIDAIDNENIRFVVSPEVIFSDVKVTGDIRVLRDVNISFVKISNENPNIVTLSLSHDLSQNFSYNLINAFGAEGDMTFLVPSNITGEISNSAYNESEKGIEKINIIDTKTIEVHYNYEITDDFLQYKLLTELRVNSLKSSGDNILNISVLDPLEKSSSYMLMIASLEDIQKNAVSFDDFLYEFTTSSNLIENNVILDEEVITLENEEIVEEGNIADVALNAAKTPDTGASTWFIILFTFMFSSVFFLKNKFRKS